MSPSAAMNPVEPKPVTRLGFGDRELAVGILTWLFKHPDRVLARADWVVAIPMLGMDNP